MRIHRNSLSEWLASKSFERFILCLIVVNAITLGLETSQLMMRSFGNLLLLLDRVFLIVFSLEIVLKTYAWRARFFKDPWGWFDLVIIAVSWIPAAGGFSALRSLRVLRALRLVSAMPRLRKVVTGLLSSLPGLGAVTMLLLLLFYVGSVMATKLFGENFPQWFGNILASAYSLFQIMTLESWSMGIVRPVMEVYPYAWTFFVPFILATTFTTLNLLIAVIVNAMQSESETAAEKRAQESHEERLQLLKEFRELKEIIKNKYP